MVFIGVTMLTKSQASKLAQQRAQEAEAEAAAAKAEQAVEDEEGADEVMIGAGRHEVELQPHLQHHHQAAGSRSLGASRQSFAELSLAGSPRDSLALQSEGGAAPREREHE